MRIPLPCTVRRRISDESAAALTSAVLQDFGIITANDMSNVVDRSKMRRERDKHRQLLQAWIPTFIESLYFDGRKDQTLILVLKDGKIYQETSKEEHYVLLHEPGANNIGHISPSTGKSKDI